MVGSFWSSLTPDSPPGRAWLSAEQSWPAGSIMTRGKGRRGPIRPLRIKAAPSSLLLVVRHLHLQLAGRCVARRVGGPVVQSVGAAVATAGTFCTQLSLEVSGTHSPTLDVVGGVAVTQPIVR